jgi:hypothetical protein
MKPRDIDYALPKRYQWMTGWYGYLEKMHTMLVDWELLQNWALNLAKTSAT